MKDADLKRNASGYYDETCYKGIAAPPRPGEIWLHGHMGWLVLIVGKGKEGGVYSTLRLTERKTTGCVVVTCKTTMYTVPCMLGFALGEDLTQFVTACPAEEFEEVKQGIAKALGLTHTATEADRKKLEEENEGLKESYKTVFHENERLKADLTARNMAFDLLDASCREMTADLDRANVYKEMYLALLDKLIAAKGGIAHE